MQRPPRPRWSNWMVAYWGPRYFIVIRYELRDTGFEHLGGSDDKHRPLVKHSTIGEANAALEAHLAGKAGAA